MEDEEDLYDCVYDEEDGGEIYEDLMKTEALPPPVSSVPPSLCSCVFLLVVVTPLACLLCFGVAALPEAGRGGHQELLLD